MMISGDKSTFAIETAVESVSKGWIHGNIRFWFYGAECGNWNDIADLKGCVSWLNDFAENSVNRYEEKLINLPKEELFRLLLRAVLGRGDGEQLTVKDQPIKDAYSRFYISHLGMSSFDAIHMMLLEDEKIQRCLWCPVDTDNIHDFRFPSGQMQKTARGFCRQFVQKFAREMEVPKS